MSMQSLTLTNQAVDRIKNVMASNNECPSFRVYVTGGAVLAFNMALSSMIMLLLR